MCRCPGKPEDVGSPGAGIRGGSEIPDVASGYQTWFLWERSILVRVSVDKPHDQKQLGGKSLSQVTHSLHHEREVRAGAQAEPGGRN